MTDHKREEPRYIRAIVTSATDATFTISVEAVELEKKQTRATILWLWAYFAFILLGAGVTVWLLFHPQAIEPVARAGEWLYGLLP